MIIYSSWIKQTDIILNKDIGIVIWVDKIRNIHQQEYDSLKKVLVLIEPKAINRKVYNQVTQHHEYFDLILTYDDFLLKNCKNARLFLHGETFISNQNMVSNKEFIISMVCGFKNATVGHKFRRSLYDVQKNITIPRLFYRSRDYKIIEAIENNPILGKKLSEKIKLIENSMFHLCIENSQQKNYFTEKIIDCFITKTIPIYWGCPNIEDFFDKNGIIIVSDDINDIIKKINLLTEKDYDDAVKALCFSRGMIGVQLMNFICYAFLKSI